MNKAAQTPSAWAPLQHEWFSLSFFPERNEQQSFHYRVCSVKDSKLFCLCENSVKTLSLLEGLFQGDSYISKWNSLWSPECTVLPASYQRWLCEWGILMNSPSHCSKFKLGDASNTIVTASGISLSVKITVTTTCQPPVRFPVSALHLCELTVWLFFK